MAILPALRILPLLFALSAQASLLDAQEGNGSLPPLRLRPGDAVRVEVRDEPALTGEYPIDGDGRALLPLVGLVDVAGRAFDEVRRDVAEAYARELVRPVVRVTPILRIAVLGEVTRPGLVTVDPTYALADVLASAGGLTPSANRDGISLMRNGERVLTTSIDELDRATAPILPGDQVIVARRSWVQDNLTVVVGAGASVLAALVTALVLR